MKVNNHSVIMQNAQTDHYHRCDASDSTTMHVNAVKRLVAHAYQLEHLIEGETPHQRENCNLEERQTGPPKLY